MIVGEPKTKLELANQYLEFVVWKALKYSKEEYIKAICSEGKLPELLGVSYPTITALNKRIYPGITRCTRPITYILDYYNYKYCKSCDKCLLQANFDKNKSLPNNLHGYCKQCRSIDKKLNRGLYNSSSAKRHATKLKATPSWGQQGIKEFYTKCPKGYHVDHIIPLQGKTVCGLHVLNNLQYLPAQENLSKGNNYNDWDL